MIHTNRCKHCGKTKEEHLCHDSVNGILGNDPIFCGQPLYSLFTDSGLAALDAHKEELYAFATKVLKLWEDDNESTMIGIDSAMKELQSILNQIEKEK